MLTREALLDKAHCCQTSTAASDTTNYLGSQYVRHLPNIGFHDFVKA